MSTEQLSEQSQEPQFAAMEKSTVGTQAADVIKNLIVSGQLGPGDVLPSERDLAGMLGISRPSVREGIRILGAMNVLESRHGGGTFVTSLNPNILAQPISFLLQVQPGAVSYLFEVRRVLEVEAARMAAERIDEAALDELDRIARAAGEALDDPALFMEKDFGLHNAVVEATANPIYRSLYRSIAELSLASRRATVTDAAVRRDASEAHARIVAALRARDGAAAAEAMTAHLAAVERSYAACAGSAQ